MGSGIYGRGFTSSKIKDALLQADDYGEGNFWTESSNAIANLYDATNKSLDSSFNEAIAAAYGAKLRNQYGIRSSGTVGMAENELYGQGETAYMQAYDTYRNSLLKGRESATESYTQAITQLNKELDERSEMFAKYGESYYDYLQFLYDTYYGDETIENNIWNRQEFQDFLVANVDEQSGETTYDLIAKDKLYSPTYVTEGDKKFYTGLFDEEGNLTAQGTKYFDLLENYFSKDENNEGYITFGNWLFDTDKELYDWAYEEGQNIYDWSSDGTNAGTWRELTGRSSRDYDYSWVEHLGSMTTEKVKDTFSDIQTRLNDMDKWNLKDKATDYLTNVSDVITDLEKLTTELGVTQDIEEGMGITWSELRKYVNQVKRLTTTQGDMAGEWFGTAAEGLVIGAGGGFAAGGPLGATIGGIAGLLTGIGFGSANTDDTRNRNKQVSTAVKYEMQNLIDNIVSYSIAKQDNPELNVNTYEWRRFDRNKDYTKTSKPAGNGGRGI